MVICNQFFKFIPKAKIVKTYDIRFWMGLLNVWVTRISHIPNCEDDLCPVRKLRNAKVPRQQRMFHVPSGAAPMEDLIVKPNNGRPKAPRWWHWHCRSPDRQLILTEHVPGILEFANGVTLTPEWHWSNTDGSISDKAGWRRTASCEERTAHR